MSNTDLSSLAAEVQKLRPRHDHDMTDYAIAQLHYELAAQRREKERAQFWMALCALAAVLLAFLWGCSAQANRDRAAVNGRLRDQLRELTTGAPVAAPHLLTDAEFLGLSAAQGTNTAAK